MINLYKKNILIILFIGFYLLGFSQSNEIKIRFIGNCGLHLSDGKTNLYVDFPYKSGAFGYMKYNVSEIDSINENAIFIFTHKHPDHFSKKMLRKVKGKRKGKVFVNGKGKKYEALSATIDDFKIELFKNKHRFSFKHHSYLITWHGKRIFFSGDTETSATIASLKDMDWAFVPGWILMDAKEKNVTIDAKKIGVYHLYPNQKVTNSRPEKYLILDKQGMVIQ
jgi:L-ascorbate metabolism protein UlaG (beta-lactamase superfamily)